LVQVKFTNTQRTTLTAFAFIDGIFGSTVDVKLPQPIPADPLLKVRILKITKQGYTGCPRRNVPDFGRVFLMLNYTDITQNT